jgi:hypothetical protein
MSQSTIAVAEARGQFGNTEKGGVFVVGSRYQKTCEDIEG